MGVLVWLSVAVGAWAGQGERVTVEPDWGVAGHYGTWTVSYQVGDAGVSEGGVLRVQLPDYWHAGPRNSAIRLQASKPTWDNHVRAYASREGVALATIVEDERENRLIKHAKDSLDGRWERYVFVVRVTVEEGELSAGDRIDVVYGDTSGGSRGMTAPIIADVPQPILAAVDAQGNGAFREVERIASISSRAGAPRHLWASGPSDLVVGQEAELRFSIVDAWFNPVEDYEAEFRFVVHEGEVEIEPSRQVRLEHGGGSVRFTPTEPGIVRIDVEAEGRLFEGRSNPMRVHAEKPERRVYWGDLHSHTEYSWDGVGHSAFNYARHVTHLDFYAMSDHSIAPRDDGYTRGLNDAVWDEYTALTEAHHENGRFVTIHAYEASFRSPYGHHNVYFRGDPGPLLAPQRVTLVQLWSALTAGNALTIPHHTGKMPRPIEWHPQDSDYRRNIELYSAHGSSETFDPEHPLAFEQSDFTSPSRSARHPQFVQHAWAHRLKLSVIGASDDHYSQPGKPHYGLAAVRADELSRDGIFEAMHDRRTYATTGARILLDFEVDGVPMGRRHTTNGPLMLDVNAHGHGVIEKVEILRYVDHDHDHDHEHEHEHEQDHGHDHGHHHGPAHHPVFEVVHELRPGEADVRWHVAEPAVAEPTIYYVRVRERDEILGRAVMAWSSPIWVEPASSD